MFFLYNVMSFLRNAMKEMIRSVIGVTMRTVTSVQNSLNHWERVKRVSNIPSITGSLLIPPQLRSILPAAASL